MNIEGIDVFVKILGYYTMGKMTLIKGLFLIFEIQKVVFCNLDLNLSDMDFISEPFLPQNPEELLRSGQFNTDVEVIIGTNSDEGLILLLG